MRLSEKGFSNNFPTDQKMVQKLSRMVFGIGQVYHHREARGGWSATAWTSAKGVFSRLGRIAFEVPLLCLQWQGLTESHCGDALALWQPCMPNLEGGSWV